MVVSIYILCYFVSTISVHDEPVDEEWRKLVENMKVNYSVSSDNESKVKVSLVENVK